MSKPGDRRPVTARTVLLWLAPLVAASGVLVLTFAMNWEPWFGYAGLIAGVLAALMLIGRHFGVDGS